MKLEGKIRKGFFSQFFVFMCNYNIILIYFSVTSSLFPLLSPTQVLPRLFSIVFAFFPVYLLLSLLYPFEIFWKKMYCEVIYVKSPDFILSQDIINQDNC